MVMGGQEGGTVVKKDEEDREKDRKRRQGKERGGADIEGGKIGNPVVKKNE